MNTIKRQPNQTNLDMVISASGTMKAAMQLMFANNQSLTEFEDDTLNVPGGLHTDANTLTYLRNNRIQPGTAG
jgi:hypothetical protein